jgi:hypothetical protein
MFQFLRGVTLIAALLVMVSGASAEPDHYLCVVDQAFGLHYNPQTKAWGPQAFSAGKKYLLRRLNGDDRDKAKGKWWSLLLNNPKANWAFFEFGVNEPMPQLACYEGADSYGIFGCQRVILDGSFDKDTLRFELASHGGYTRQGYWEQLRQKDPEHYKDLLSRKEGLDADHPDDLFFEIGKCSPF